MGSPTVANLQALDTTLPRRTPQPLLCSHPHVSTYRNELGHIAVTSSPSSTAHITTASRVRRDHARRRNSGHQDKATTPSRAGGPAAAFRGQLVATIARRRNSDRLFHQYIQCVHRAATLHERRIRLHAPFWSPKQAVEVAHAIGDRHRTAQWGHAIAPTPMATEIRRSAVR